MPSVAGPVRSFMKNKVTYFNSSGSGPFEYQDSQVYGLIGTTGRVTNANSDWRVKVVEKQEAGTYYYVKNMVGANGVMRADWYDALRNHWFQDVAWNHAQSFMYDDTDPVLRDQALMKLKRAFLSQRQQWKSIAPLAEARELRGLVTRSLYFLINVIKALIEAKRKANGFVLLQEASAIWLTAAFGLAPMLRDIEDARKALASLVLDSNTYRLRISKRKRKEFTGQESFKIGASGVDGVRFHLAANCALQYRFTAGFDVNILAAEDYNGSVLKTFGLTAGDLLPAVWELTPYSWVVDYLATVQPWLEDLFFDDGGAFVYGSESRRFSAEGTITPVLDVSSKRSRVTYVKAGNFSVQLYERKVLAQLPRVGLRFKTADEIGKNAASKLANLCSVLIGRQRPWSYKDGSFHLI